MIDTYFSETTIAPVGSGASGAARLRQSIKRRAFSFVELLSVMAVISVVSGLAVVGVNGGSAGTALETGGRKVAQYLELARSEAIRRHAVVRFVAAREWAHRDDATLRRFSLWAWDAEAEVFTPITPWEELPVGTVFEPELPDYTRNSSYAEADPSTVRADCILADSFAKRAGWEIEDQLSTISSRYVEFLPSGNARIPGASTRKAAFVVTQGYIDPDDGTLHYRPTTPDGPKNWAQVNVDTLTGNVRFYRP